MIEKWKIIKSKFVFDNQWFKIRQDEVELPNGKTIDDFFVLIRPDIVLTLAITSSHEIVFVRQYRHATGEILLELPAGSFNPKLESAETAARRELIEETGYIPQEMIPLGTLYDNPIKDTNTIHLFLAKDIRPSGFQQLDATEEIEVVLIPVAQVMEKIAQGEIRVSGTLAAIYLGLSQLK